MRALGLCGRPTGQVYPRAYSHSMVAGGLLVMS